MQPNDMEEEFRNAEYAPASEDSAESAAAALPNAEPPRAAQPIPADLLLNLANRPRKKAIYQFQVLLDPVSKKNILGWDVRHHVIMAPYYGKKGATNHFLEQELPIFSPLRLAVEECRKRGIKVYTGVWEKIKHHPIAIVFDISNMPLITHRYCYEIARDHEIFISLEDLETRLAVTLGYCAAEFLVQFEIAVGIENISKKSWIRFYNWHAAAGPIFLRTWGMPVTKVEFLMTSTQLKKQKPPATHYIEAKRFLYESERTSRFELEAAACYHASRVLLAKGLELGDIERKMYNCQISKKGRTPKWVVSVRRRFQRQSKNKVIKETRKAMKIDKAMEIQLAAATATQP